MPHLLVIDCKDSFVYNLVQLLREQKLYSLDICSVDEVPLEQLGSYDALLLSPGPGVPEELPLLMKAIELCAPTHPILGVCLGHQALSLHFGAELKQLPKPRHGHRSTFRYKPDPLFAGLEEGTQIGRYHSWVIAPESLPSEIEPIGWCEEGEEPIIMAIRHRTLPIYGVQFHPESMMTERGKCYIYNFLDIAKRHRHKQD